MEKANLTLLGSLILAVMIIGCNPVYLHHSPGIVIKYKKVVSTPVYEDIYEDAEYDEYREETTVVEVHTSTEVWIGTSFVLGSVRNFWCDFCAIWHPRCVFGHCYCALIVRHHYGYYVFNHYYDHCYTWVYQPHYVPVISRYRFKNNGRYYSYQPERRKRDFLRKGGTSQKKQRVRYRGKEENRYTYEQEKVKRTSETNSGRDREIVRKGSGGSKERVNGSGVRKRDYTANTDGKRVQKPSGGNKEKESRSGGERNTSTSIGTRTNNNGNGQNGERKQQAGMRTKKENGKRSFLSRIGSIISKHGNSGKNGKKPAQTKSGNKSQKTPSKGKVKIPANKKPPKKRTVKKKNL